MNAILKETPSDYCEIMKDVNAILMSSYRLEPVLNNLDKESSDDTEMNTILIEAGKESNSMAMEAASNLLNKVNELFKEYGIDTRTCSEDYQSAFNSYRGRTHRKLIGYFDKEVSHD